MSTPSTALRQDPTPAAEQTRIAVATRFGEVSFNRDMLLTLPYGIMGFSQFHDYGLANLPEERHRDFKLLQCINEPSLSFIVVPRSPDGVEVPASDLAPAFEALGIAEADRATLYIVSLRKLDDQVQMSVNLRAPLLIDARRRLARQFVLPSTEYAVRHVVALDAPR